MRYFKEIILFVNKEVEKVVKDHHLSFLYTLLKTYYEVISPNKFFKKFTRKLILAIHLKLIAYLVKIPNN